MNSSVDDLPVSVLMTTYAGTPADFLYDAIDSVAKCVPKPAQLVLVVDGPLNKKEEDLLEEIEASKKFSFLDIVRLPKNCGLGTALNAGVPYCSYDWIARMDSDDYCLPDRFKLQWKLTQDRPDVDLVCGWQIDFEEKFGSWTGIKTVPEEHEDIASTLIWRCAVPHPSIMVRKSHLESIGGYWKHRFAEDYDLFFRLISNGTRFYGIQKVILAVRAPPAQRNRRGGWKVLKLDLLFRWACFRRGDFGFFTLMSTSIVYSAFRLSPNFIKSLFYNFSRLKSKNLNQQFDISSSIVTAK